MPFGPEVKCLNCWGPELSNDVNGLCSCNIKKVTTAGTGGRLFMHGCWTGVWGSSEGNIFGGERGGYLPTTTCSKKNRGTFSDRNYAKKAVFVALRWGTNTYARQCTCMRRCLSSQNDHAALCEYVHASTWVSRDCSSRVVSGHKVP